MGSTIVNARRTAPGVILLFSGLLLALLTLFPTPAHAAGAESAASVSVPAATDEDYPFTIAGTVRTEGEPAADTSSDEDVVDAEVVEDEDEKDTK